MKFFTRKRLALVVAPLAVLAVALGVGGGVAFASSSAAPSPLFGCISTSTRTISQAHTASVPTCPAGTFQFQTGANGAPGKTGATGAAGAKGATGAQGPSGVQAVVNTPIAGMSGVPTGGSFNSKAVQVGTANLPAAGTYLLNLSAQSEPSADSSSGGVVPQFFVYDQPKNADFTGDLLNIGAGTLAPAGTDHDSYASGSAVVTVDGPTQLIIYGFGYDNDSGASDFNLITGGLTAVQLTPAA
jgi:hypothetical protein